MPIITFSDGVRKKVIGTLNPVKGVFSKNVKESKHLFRVLDAWGVDARLFSEILLPADYLIVLTDKGDGIRYSVRASEFSKNGTHYHFKNGERDHGAQIFLPRLHWEKERII